MFKLGENDNFHSISEEIRFEFQDMMEFISYIFGESSTQCNFIGLLKDKYQNPANDNWSISAILKQEEVA